MVPLVAGLCVGMGAHRGIQSRSCPDFVQNRFEVAQAALKSQPVVRMVCVISFLLILTSKVLVRLNKRLIGRTSRSFRLVKFLASAMGAYRISIPFLLGITLSLSRTECLENFFKRLKSLYALLERTENFISNSLSDPEALMTRIGEGLKDGIIGLGEAAESMLFANDPEVIQKISQELSDFEDHLEKFVGILPEFEKKLEGCKALLQKYREELAEEIGEMENQSAELEKLIAAVDTEYVGFFENKMKKLLGFQSLKGKQVLFEAKLTSVRRLAQKVEFVIEGIDLIKRADLKEQDAIEKWNAHVYTTPLLPHEHALHLADSARVHFRNLFMTKKKLKLDDLLVFRRKRIKLYEMLPKPVEDFAQALRSFKLARRSLMRNLSDLKVDDALEKDQWNEEKALLNKGKRLFERADQKFLTSSLLPAPARLLVHHLGFGLEERDKQDLLEGGWCGIKPAFFSKIFAKNGESDF